MIVALVAIGICLSASAPRAAALPGGSNLSPSLAQLARPAVAKLPPAAQARRLGLAPSGPGSLLREGNRVLVNLRFDRGAGAALAALRAAGARIVAASSRYQTVTAAVLPAALPEVAAVGGVESVTENREPIVYGAGESSSTNAVGVECEGGSVISEGVSRLNVASARSEYGVNGSGVTVGVLSDSFNQATLAAGSSKPVATHASEDMASGDLPGPSNPCSGEKTAVDVLEDFPSSPEYQATDEGRAMLQIVHDVAPDADLAFATAFNGEISFAQNIEKLAKPVSAGGAGAKVIADDVAYFEEPFFQDGPIANAVNKVAGEGVAYFSAAGNDNIIASGHEVASYEAPFRDAHSCPAGVPVSEGTDCMDFDPGSGVDNAYNLSVAPKGEVMLDIQWAEPWNGVHTDLDAYLLNGSGSVLQSSTLRNVSHTQRPFEFLQWKNEGSGTAFVEVAIPRVAGVASPTIKFEQMGDGSAAVLPTAAQYSTSSAGDSFGPAIFGHTAAANAISVAAERYNVSGEPDSYSSRGPVEHYFEPVNEVAAALPKTETIAKPNITATDCGATTFFASYVESEATWRFCGTSAAAPHAAGVAALELQADPTASVAEIRNAQTSTATPIGSFGTNAVGAGLLNASAAVADLLPPPVVTLTAHPASRTGDNTPTFGFEASQPATFTCAIDGGASHACSSPYTVPTPLADGSHEFEVDAVSGNSVIGTASFSFTVDTVAPAITQRQRRGRRPVAAAGCHPHRPSRESHR